MTFDKVLALCVNFNGQSVWGAKVVMDEEHAVIYTKDGDYLDAHPEDVIDELLMD